jgi:hypothetical protein
MANKKTRARFTPTLDEQRPAKAAVDARAEYETPAPPSYEGPQKAGGTASRPGPSKAEFVAGPAPDQGSYEQLPAVADMQPPDRAGPESPEQREQYIRLRIRVRDGRMTVVDSHLVDGPLTQATAFPGTNAYEVTLGDRLLHAGALPDLGVQRSFVAPNPAEGERAHHITERETFEFSARVPAGHVSADTIADIAVRLHRVKGEPRADRLSGARLDVQFEREMRLVSEIRGLPESALPEEIERRGGCTPRLG